MARNILKTNRRHQMSIFDSKINKSVAEAVMKVLEAEQKEKMAKKDHDQDGKIESGKDEYLGSRIRAARLAGKLKEDVQQLNEAFPSVEDAKKRMSAGKTATGSVTKTKTGLVHKRDYEDESDSEDTQKASKKTGARQNNFNRGKSTGYISKPKAVKEETKLSFTEMLQLYNEAGLEVIAKIVPEKVEFGDIEVEVFDADKINGTIETTVVEEVDNETFTKEVEAQKEKNAGRGKKAEVAKASVQAVKQEEYEQIDELKKSTVASYIQKKFGKMSDEPVSKNQYGYAKKDAKGIQRAGLRMSGIKATQKEEVEQLDELSKDTLSMYVKKAHYSGGMADFKHGRIADKRGDSKDKMKLSKISRNRERGINKAVDRLTKKD